MPKAGLMEDIGIRELNQQTSRVLRRVAATGRGVAITDHGRRVAMIVPIPSGRYAQMVAAGEVTEGTSRVRPVARVRLERPSGEILDELRRDAR